MSVLTPTTELEAVNEMLASIGEAPVNKLGSGLEESAIALNLLRAVSKQVQAVGWFFNKESRTLSPTLGGEFHLPQNTLKLDDNTGRYVQRGLRLYDRQLGSFNLAAKRIEVSLVMGLPFSELTETARTFIYLKAARRFQERFLGSNVLSSYEQRDEVEAYNQLKQEEMEAGNYNMLKNPETLAMLNGVSISSLDINQEGFHTWED